ncbi:MAG: HEAT repeat domain-containing protein [Candidatus Eremiobacterota bacterium]
MFKNLYKNFIRKFTIPASIKLLEDPSQDVMDRAFNSLVAEGNEAIKFLEPYLKDKRKIVGKAFDDDDKVFIRSNKTQRETIAEILSMIGTEEGVKSLINATCPDDIPWQRFLQKKIASIGEVALLPLFHALHTGERDKQLLSAEVLGLMGNKKAVPPLLKALPCSENRVRVAIIDSLGQLKAREGIDPLLDLLGGQCNEIEKNTIKFAISEIGNPAVDKLLLSLKGTDLIFKKSVIEILGHINDNRIAPALMEYLRFKDDKISSAAVYSLGKKTEALNLILEGLEDSDPYFRMNCASVLGKMISLGSVDALIKACGDENEAVAKNAIKALGETGSDLARDNLMKLLKNNNYYHGKTVMETLARMSDRAVPPLINALSDRDFAVIERASYSLSKIGQRAIVPLIEAVRYRKELRDCVRKIFKEIGNPVIPFIIKFLSEEDEELCEFASHVLSDQGEASLGPLQKLFFESPHWPVKKRAGHILSMTGVKSLNILVKGLNDKSMREFSSQVISSIGPSVIKPLTESFEKINYPEYISKIFSSLGPSVIPELLKYMDNENDMIRRYTLDGIIRMNLFAIKPLSKILEGEISESKKQKLLLIIIEILRNYKPVDKKLSTMEIDSLRSGIEILRKYREKCGSSVVTLFGVKWGKSAEKLLLEAMDVSPKDLVIFMDDEADGPKETSIEIIDGHPS